MTNIEYDDFVNKFEAKKTTDDCYTPTKVYNAVLEWVGKLTDISQRAVVRPFFPNGDYKTHDYPKGCIVVDNPPFSILSKIRKWYIAHGIDYVLFAPHLTLFSADIPDSKVITDITITYHNGATINTSFVTNIKELSAYEIITDPELTWSVFVANKESEQKKSLAKYSYPDNVITASKIGKIAPFARLRIERNQLRRISQLDSQRASKKGLFGGGYLCGDNVADVIRDASDNHLAKVEQIRSIYAEERQTYVWELSERERNVIQRINDGISEAKQLELFPYLPTL